MSLKDLAINFDLIPVKLGEFADGPVSTTNKGARCVHFKFEKHQKTVLVIAHRKNGGTTTLQPSGGGQNLEIAKEAANYVVDNIDVVAKKPFNLVLESYNLEKFNVLKAFLLEECDGTIVSESKKEYMLISCKISGKQGDTLTFNLYESGKLVIQGRPVVLAVGLIQFVGEESQIHPDELLHKIHEIYEIPTTVEAIEVELTGSYSFAYDYAGENLRTLLRTAISLQRSTIDLVDYSPMSHPALRALESFMKKSVINACNEDLREFRDVFDKIGQVPPRYIVKPRFKATVNCEDTCKLLEECYSYYIQHRHGTFHAGGLDADIRTIPTMQEAIDITSNCLGLINNHSKILLEKP